MNPPPMEPVPGDNLPLFSPPAGDLKATIEALNGLWRPIGSIVMTAFGGYCHLKGVDMEVTAHLLFDGAFPAWMASRHMQKGKL